MTFDGEVNRKATARAWGEDVGWEQDLSLDLLQQEIGVLLKKTGH